MPKKKKKCNWGRYIRKEYVIMAYSPDDEYEFPVKIYLSCKEMAEDLKINIDKVYTLVEQQYVFRQTNLRYMKVKCYF